VEGGVEVQEEDVARRKQQQTETRRVVRVNTGPVKNNAHHLENSKPLESNARERQVIGGERKKDTPEHAEVQRSKETQAKIP